MPFVRSLASDNSRVIKEVLFPLLDKITSEDVLQFDQEFRKANDKHKLLAKFEASALAPSKRNPELLERWTHYCWVRLELTYLIHQKAALNQIMAMKKKIRRRLVTKTPFIAPTLESVQSAIQEAAEKGVPMRDSINIIKQMALQIVSTEHPTDPLSQTARDTITDLAHEIDKKKPAKDKIKQLLGKLLATDPIPQGKRNVVDEVKRNIEGTLSKLYDNLPALVQEVVSAYKAHYGKEVYQAHESELFKAMEGGIDADGRIISPFVRDAFWPGFDADGNENITPEAMKDSIRLYRLSIAKKHLSALELIEKALCQLEESEEKKAFISELLQLKQLFVNYEKAIAADLDAITVKNDKGETVLVSQYVTAQYHQLLLRQEKFLTDNSALNMQLRCFGIQLHSFGLTYGVAHVRQDSSVFTDAWATILAELISDPRWVEHPILQALQGRKYTELEPSERYKLHKQLQNGDASSREILGEIHRRYQASQFTQERVKTELGRLELTLRHEDLFENIIISNSETAANILEVESLLAIFPMSSRQSHLTIVPLLEKCEDLKNYESILLDYIKTRIQHEFEEKFDAEEAHQRSSLKSLLGVTSRDEIKLLIEMKSREEFRLFLESKPNLAAYLSPIKIEIMVGFSDTERVSGVSALIPVQKVQEDFMLLARDFGVTPKIYHGPGGDLNRGGLKRRDQKGTLQGNARSNVLNTDTSARWFRENQFYQAYQFLAEPSKRMEFANLTEEEKGWLTTCMEKGVSFYEHLHDHKSGLGQLMGYMLGQGPHWMVTALNSSSRATQRGSRDDKGDRTASLQTNGKRPESYINPDKPRAITAAQMKEILADYSDFFGSCVGLRAIGLEKSLWLYDRSETFRDMVEKDFVAVSMRDLSFMSHALFAEHPHLIPRDEQERKQWAKECEETYPELLKTKNVEEMSKDPKQRDLLLTMLSRLFAYIEEECIETRHFLLRMMRSMHPIKDHKDQTNLITHNPVGKEHLQTVVCEAEPLYYVLSRLCHHVAEGEKLDTKYAGLNEQVVPYSSGLTGVGRLIGNVGSGITAARIMQPGHHEGVFAAPKNRRWGVRRSDGLKKEVAFPSIGELITANGFFAKTLVGCQKKVKEETRLSDVMTNRV